MKAFILEFGTPEVGCLFFEGSMTKPKKVLISFFILFNFMAMMRTHLPIDQTFFSSIYRPVDSYLSFFSIYQDWVMFAPNPSKINVHLTADVEFLDGSQAHYQFPRSSKLNILEKYAYGERFRKIISEAIRNDSHSYMWKDTAKFAMRKLKDENFNKIPLRVHLSRHWNETPNIDTEFRSHGSKSSTYASYRFYTHEVLQ